MIKNKNVNKKIVLFILLAAAIAGFLSWNFLIRDSAFSGDNTSINYGPPTEEEKKAGDAIKPTLIEQEQVRNKQPEQTASGKRVVTPTITYAGQYNSNVEVGAFVGGVFEDGGECTLTLQKDNNQQTVKVTGVKGANSVSCPVMAIPLSNLAPGKWQATVSYSSSSSEGKSQPRDVEVN